MPYRFFTIPVVHGEDAEREFNSFLAGHRNVRVDKHFVADGERSFWAVAVAFATAGKPGGEGKPAEYEPKVRYEDEMTPEQYALFTELREMRNTIAEESKVPAYKVFNNAELASMVRELPESIAGLRKIRGIGKAKTEAHGEVFLEKLRQARNGAGEANPGSAGDEAEGTPF